MINVNDIKNGMTIKYEGNVYQVIEFQHVKPGKGAAFVRTKLKNVKTGATVEITFNSSIKIEKANIQKKNMTYLYGTGSEYIFMDMENYDQVSVDENILGDNTKYLKENLEVEAAFFEGEMIGITLPEKVTYKVIDAEMAVKGNTTSQAQKDITLENGYVVKAPLFINVGEEVVITTSDGKYSSRA